VNERYVYPKDGLAPARGCLYGLLFSLAIVVVVALAGWLVYRAVT
jgi:hypothetical protein